MFDGTPPRARKDGGRVMRSTRAMREALNRQGIVPGTLSLAEAAAFTGLSPNTFLLEVEAGTMPQPLALKSRRKLWSRAALARACGDEDTATPADIGQKIAEAIDAYAV